MNLKFREGGLIPMVIQDVNGGAVLSLFYANKEALKKIRQTGYVWRFSRSKKKLMKKGATSGNVQKVVSVEPDCEGNALLIRVFQKGPSCHKGRASCFSAFSESTALSELISVIRERKKSPKPGSYTSTLLESRRIIEGKLWEECGELIDAKKKKEVIWEAADLLYFMLVFLEKKDVEFREVLRELSRRRKSPGGGNPKAQP